ncbi:VOC family protein [Bacillus sp. 1P06AnD]|uniref:VOC family protein n=1 Tax=Bacillus sp. 1P06AnD TaxID=3132208 RepID=UPI0039A07268
MAYHFTGIDHIQLAAPKGSEEEARAFFGGILGLAEVEKPEHLKERGGVWFSIGSQQIHIGIEHSFIPAKKAHPAFEVDHISGLKEHLRSKGVKVVEDSLLPGADRIYVADPFGNRIEILQWI